MNWENDDSRKRGNPKYKLKLDQAEVLAGPWIFPAHQKALKRAFKGIARPMWIVRGQ